MKSGRVAASGAWHDFALTLGLLITVLPTNSSVVRAEGGSWLIGSARTIAVSPAIRIPALQVSADETAREIESALGRGDLITARRLLPRLLQSPRLNPDGLLRIGANLAQHELYPEAAQVFRRCTNENPQLFEGFYNLALAQLALQQYQYALGTLAKAPQASRPEEIARTYLRGKVELALEQHAKAERDLSAAFAAAPQEENVSLDLGLCYIRERKYEHAAEVFQRALGFQKNSPFLQLGLALAQFLGGLITESVLTCRTLLASQPNFSPARVMMAFALYMQGKTGEAVSLSAQGLYDPKPFPYLYYIHAVSLLKLQCKDYHTLVNELTRAARSIPQCSLCYLALSKVHRKQGDLGAATADLEKAVRLDAKLAEGWYNLATVYDQAGRSAEARAARQRFEELKERKANLETEMLREAFVKALAGGGEGSSQKAP